jgi:hypothetical protein
LAAHEWSAVPADARPRGDHAWPAVADVTVLVAAVALLARDLAAPAHPDAAAIGQAYARERDGWELALANLAIPRLDRDATRTG